MRLRCGDDAFVTLGPQLQLKKNTFQGLVLPLNDASAGIATSAAALLAHIQLVPRLQRFEHFPHALRVRRSCAKVRVDVPECVDSSPSQSCYRTPLDTDVFERSDDDSESGVGDRLLHVLQRWQVENVAVVVARADASLSGRLIGAQVFQLMAEAAKLALEQHYVASATATDAAKLEVMATAAGQSPRGLPYQVLLARQQEVRVANRKSSNQQQPHTTAATASVCRMTSDTVATTWPATTDGSSSSHKTTREGRIRHHFLYDRHAATARRSMTTAKAPTATATATNTRTRRNSRLASGHDTLASLHSNDDDVAVVHTPRTDGIPWLDISRDELLALQRVRVPTPALHYVLMGVVVVLLEAPLASHGQSNESVLTTPTLASCSWATCCSVVLHQSHNWRKHLSTVRGVDLTPSQVTALRALLQEPALVEPALLRVASAAVKIFKWLQQLLDECDALALGLQVAEPTTTLLRAHANCSGLASQSPLQPSMSQSPVRQQQQQLQDEQALANALCVAASSKPHGAKIVDRGRLFVSK